MLWERASKSTDDQVKKLTTLLKEETRDTYGKMICCRAASWLCEATQ